MKRFTCQSCGQPVFFENTRCNQCHAPLGYMPEAANLAALAAEVGGLYHPIGQNEEPRAFCANHAYDVCNWLAPALQPKGTFCFACQFNRVIPNLNIPGNTERWRKLEFAKHRLVYTILRLRLPVKNRQQDPQEGLVFDFLDDPPQGWPPIMTGHNNGVITIATKEADDAYREHMRVEMGEYYRTLLGISGMKLAITTGISLSVTVVVWSSAGPCLGMTGQITKARCKNITPVQHRVTGGNTMSATMPCPILGRILPKHGRIIFI